MNDEELSTLIRKNATRHKASKALRAGVRTQIALQTARTGQSAARGTPHWRIFGWRSALAGFAGGVALTMLAIIIVPRFVLQDALPAELVADHVRALKIGPLFEVASSDRHTVKPWFQGKLDYAPPVIDLEADGFPLLGGRIERVAGAPVAALAYTARKHIVNVFVWPLDKEQPPRHLQRSGFNLLHWSDGAMQIWVVSDVEAGELDRFAQAWRARAASP
jgi:anti-sigma factor RsiW